MGTTLKKKIIIPCKTIECESANCVEPASNGISEFDSIDC